MKTKILLLLVMVLGIAHAAEAQRYDRKRYDDRRDNHRYEHRRYDRHNDRRNDDRVYAMDDRSFSQVLQVITNESFSSTKMEIARSVVQNNWLTVSQITQIMSQFSFESDKLDFAKMAFYKCVNPENYYSVLNQFSFSSSKEEMSRIIAGY